MKLLPKKISSKYLGLLCVIEWTEQKPCGGDGIHITTHILIGRLTEVDKEKCSFLQCLHRTHISNGNWGSEPVWEKCTDFEVRKEKLIPMQHVYFNATAHSNSVQQYLLGRDRRYGLWPTWSYVQEHIQAL